MAHSPREPHEPTVKQLIALMNSDEREYWTSASGTPAQRERFWETIKARWRREQELQVLREQERLPSPKGQSKPKSWIHRIPVWKKLGPWLKWAAPASFGFATGMVGVGEYAAAELALGLTILCYLVQTWVWQRKTNRCIWNMFVKLVSGTVIIVVGAFAMILVVSIKGPNDWTHLRRPGRSLVTSADPPQPSNRAPIDPTPLAESQQARKELRAEASDSLRDIAVKVHLKRSYSIQELGHFRILYVISDRQTPKFFLGCRDGYAVNENIDLTIKQFGMWYTMRFREPKAAKSYVEQSVYTHGPKHETSLTGSPSVSELNFTIHLYKRIPSYRTLGDLNRCILFIYITDTLSDKIGEISFVVNEWELVSAKVENLEFDNDRPPVKWFTSLSSGEKRIQWRGVFLRRTDAKKNYLVAWPIDFAKLNPRKIPAPDVIDEPDSDLQLGARHALHPKATPSR
jgi:hypothetical protein